MSKEFSILCQFQTLDVKFIPSRNGGVLEWLMIFIIIISVASSANGNLLFANDWISESFFNV